MPAGYASLKTAQVNQKCRLTVITVSTAIQGHSLPMRSAAASLQVRNGLKADLANKVKKLRSFVNLTEPNFVLYVSKLADALRPGVPHPVTCLVGEEGSTKSTTANILRSLVDPSDIPLCTLPGTVRDLFVNASGAQVLAFDNVSSISPQISDALCQIASGSGFASRKLFTDTDLVLIGGSRSVILKPRTP